MTNHPRFVRRAAAPEQDRSAAITLRLGQSLPRYTGWLPNRPLHRALYLAAATVIALAALVTYRSIGTLVDTSAWVKHTYEVVVALESVMFNLASAEANHRGFLLDGDVRLLRQAEQAMGDTWAALARAETLTRDNPVQQQRFPELRRALTERFASMARRKEAASADAPASNELERQIAVAKALEDDLLEQRLRRAAEARNAAAASAAAAGTLGLVLLLLLGYFTERDRRRMQVEIGERERAERNVRDMANALEQRVLERTRQLTEANIELDAFSYTIAHDLRAPLRNIHGLGEALREDYARELPAVAADYVDRIQRAAQRMDSLISDLLGYSRLGRDDAKAGPVELESCIGDVLRELEPEIASCAATVAVRPPFGCVLAQRTTVNQVLTNLVTNGLKFVPAGRQPQLAIFAEERGEFWRTWVVDNGIGIDMRHAERIFRPFERLHGQEAYAGTGIGLAIVKKGVESMGGRAGVESCASGSRFWFDLRKAQR